MAARVTPVFLLSLPRSGSTLLQRVLSMHPEVATTSETWLMLPFVYALEGKGLYSDYGTVFGHLGIEAMTATIPDGRQTVRDALAGFATELYGAASPETARYFLDKTPRYSLIAPSLVDIFPGAKFLFLWRDPLSVISSCIRSLWADEFHPARLDIDLDLGVPGLVDAADRLGERAFHVRYEALAASPEEVIRPLCEWLALDSTPVLGNLGSIPRLVGRLGDPTGQEEYAGGISQAPLRHNRERLAGWFRKRWVTRKIRRLPEAFFSHAGCRRDDILQEIAKMPEVTGRDPVDAFRALGSWLDRTTAHSVTRLKRTYGRMYPVR